MLTPFAVAMQVGDVVLARDQDSGAWGWFPVTRTFVRPADDFLLLELEADDGARDQLRVTEDHPVFVEGSGWIDAGDLLVDDRVSGAWGSLRVVAIRAILEPTQVFNLEVEGAHTYFVGDLGAWVHNCDVPSPALPESPYNPAVVEARVRPPYRANPQHNPNATHGSFRTPEPPDAQAVYGDATRTGMGEWFGRGEGGWYRYFSDNAGGAHFSGIVPDNVVPINVRRGL